MPDQPTTLCTWAQFTSGAFSDLARNYVDPGAQAEILTEATRLVEQVCDRRLVGFSGLVETKRATGTDPDEYPMQGVPTSVGAALGQSYAGALGSDDGVRHVWVDQYAPRNQDLWAYADVSVRVGTTYGGAATATVSGPDPDTGHIWLSMGTWVPVGSLVTITYGGGYTVAIPADLQRGGKLMTAAILMRELQPTKQSRDPSALREDAIAAVGGYIRD